MGRFPRVKSHLSRRRLILLVINLTFFAAALVTLRSIIIGGNKVSTPTPDQVLHRGRTHFRASRQPITAAPKIVPTTIPPEYETPFSPNATIFVSISAYRDKECRDTVTDLYEKAKHPERVFAAICEQVLPGSDDVEGCMPKNLKWVNNTRIIHLPAAAAKGPTYARALVSTLYVNEDIFMQVDSHGIFIRNWDEVVVKDMNRCVLPRRSVLTHYPPVKEGMNYENETLAIREGVPLICRSKFIERGIPSFEAAVLAHSDTPRPAPFVAAGFFVAPGTIAKEVPFDPLLHHLFVGEEILLSARFWTSGYDIFAPTRNIMGHHYSRKGSPKFWEDIAYFQTMLKSEVIVKRLLHLEEPFDVEGYPYGLGTQRTIDEYWRFAGIDPVTKNITSREKFCP